MAVFVPAGATPRSFALGAFDLASINSGPSWTVTITPTFDLSTTGSTPTGYDGDQAILATSSNGGLYLSSRTIALYNNFALVVASGTLTAGPGQPIKIDVNIAAGTNASSLVVDGVSYPFTDTGGYFDATILGVGQYSNTGTFAFVGTVGEVADGLTSTSGAADNGGATSSGAMVVTSSTSGSATCGGISASGSVSVPNPSGVSACAGITCAGLMAVTVLVAAGSSACGGATSSGAMSSGSLWGSQGASATAQSVNSSQPSTGTLTTSFVARSPLTAYAQNARLTNLGRRYHVTQGGTTAAGVGPSTAGEFVDGTATLVAVNGAADTAASVTTQAANSVLVAAFSRGQWATDSSAPTDNQGNSFTILESNVYSGFTPSRSAIAVKTGAAGGSGHVFSLTYGDIGSAGDEVTGWFVEVPTGRPTSFVQDRSFVERTSPSGGVVVSNSVTTTGPAMLVAFCLGTGNVLAAGTAHTATVEAAYTPCEDADALVALATNGYIQGKAATRYVTGAGTYTATWTTAEGAHLYLVAIQEIAWAAATGSSPGGGMTSSGSIAVAVNASGSCSSGGMSSAGSILVSTSTSGSSANGTLFSSGSMAVSTSTSGSTSSGGIAGSGFVTTTAIASGAAACGGVSSSGLLTATVMASGSASCGGISSTGAASAPSTVAGAASCGGTSSAGALAVTATTSGAATCGRISSSGNLISLGVTIPLPSTLRVTSPSSNPVRISAPALAPLRVMPV